MTLSQGQPDAMESASYVGGNIGFITRAESTKDGGTASLEGCLYADFGVDQIRPILNGVSINIKLFQTTNEFSLLSVGDKKYKLKITDAIWKVYHVSLNPNVIVPHNEAIQISPAIYPVWKSDTKSFSVHGKLPSKVIIGMVSNAPYSGDYKKSL